MALAISCLSEMWDCIPDILYNVAASLGDIITTEIRPLGIFLNIIKYILLYI